MNSDLVDSELNTDAQARHAWFFMMHNNLDQVLKMIELFDHERNDLYFHVDAKVADFDNWKKEIEGTIHHAGVFFTKRFNITWGGYNQIACRLVFLEEALKKTASLLSHYVRC